MAWVSDDITEYGSKVVGGIIGTGIAAAILFKKFLVGKQDLREDKAKERELHEEDAASKRWAAYVERLDEEDRRKSEIIAVRDAEIIRLNQVNSALAQKLYETQGEVIRCEARRVELMQRIQDQKERDG